MSRLPRFIAALVAASVVGTVFGGWLARAQTSERAVEVYDPQLDLDTVRDFARNSQGQSLRGINGGAPDNETFIHTFSNLRSTVAREEICRAKLATFLVPSDNSLSYTDSISFRFYESNGERARAGWGRTLGTTLAGRKSNEWWHPTHFPEGHTYQFDLARLPVNESKKTVNLVPALNRYGRFAVWIEDDTYVKSLALQLVYCVDGKPTRSRVLQVRVPGDDPHGSPRPIEIDPQQALRFKQATLAATGERTSTSGTRIDGSARAGSHSGGALRGSIEFEREPLLGESQSVCIVGEYGSFENRSFGGLDLQLKSGNIGVGAGFSTSAAYAIVQTRAGIEGSRGPLDYRFMAVPLQILYLNRGYTGELGSGLQMLQHGLSASAGYRVGNSVRIFGGVALYGLHTPSEHAFFFGPVVGTPIELTRQRIPLFMQSHCGVTYDLNDQISVQGEISHDQLQLSGTRDGHAVEATSAQTRGRVGVQLRLKN